MREAFGAQQPLHRFSFTFPEKKIMRVEPPAGGRRKRSKSREARNSAAMARDEYGNDRIVSQYKLPAYCTLDFKT